MKPSTRTACAAVLISSIGGSAAADVITLRDVEWRDDVASTKAWQARPGWLTNPDLQASVHAQDGIGRFAVDAPGKGMKWSRSVRPLAVADAPYLVIRYKAESLRAEGDDYVVYVDDGASEHPCSPLRLRDAVTDGSWQHVAIDLRPIVRGRSIKGVALQVQAGPDGKARLFIDELALTPYVPPAARLVGQGKRPAAHTLDLSEAVWHPHPSWLGNPADQVATQRDAGSGTTTFRVEQGGRGMKWSYGLTGELDLTRHPYLVMRYRATNLSGHHDYALCFLGKGTANLGYEEVIRGLDLQPDGRWRTVTVPLARAAKRIPKAQAIAVQVQAERGPAELEIDSLRLVGTRPSTPLADVVAFQAGGAFDDFQPVDLTPACNQSLEPVLHLLHVSGWPESADITAHGVPLRLQSGPRSMAATAVEQTATLTLPVGCRSHQVCILLLAVLRGQEQPVYGGGAFRRIDDVDRFRLRLTYDDGTTEECLPGNVTTGRFEIVAGPQLLCAFADPAKTLRSISLCDRTKQAGFAVAAVTCRADGKGLFPRFDESAPARVVRRWSSQPKPGPAEVSLGADKTVVLRNDLVSLKLGTAPPLKILSLRDRISNRDLIRPEKPAALLTITLNGKPAGADRMRCVEVRSSETSPPSGRIVYELLDGPGVRAELEVGLMPSGAVRFQGRLRNAGEQPHRVGLTYPSIGPYTLGDDAAQDEYVFPCRAPYLGADNVSLEQRYGGMFGVQFMATVNAPAGRGLHLRTEDTTCIERRYALTKNDAGLLMAIRYPERPVAHGQSRALVDTILSIGDGDWHRALNDYRRWLATWHRPASPRKPWFREIFNFRQRFLHWLDPLYDPATGKIDLERAVAEARDKFGGIDYLHLFDWGNCGKHGRIYGRVGDYSPYDFIKGGRRNLYDAIQRIRAGGVPVGLYIEGYLLNERGKLGRAHGEEWQIIKPDGSGARWPSSVEIYVCPGVQAWRDVQAATYAAKVRELDVDGMYIDQFGFTGHWKDCYSDQHGHPVPSYPVRTELATTTAIRRAIDGAQSGVAIYTEESPCDVTSQVQDGSFTYEMNQLHGRRATIPVNLFRFAVPDYKTIEILYCDKPTATWATGVRWTFFNGEGLWLEGPADAWFAPQTLAAIRKCYGILRKHRDAFTSLRPVPLVDTLAGGVLANYFPGEGEEVWTLYNTRHRTFRGEVLRIRHEPDRTWHDAWHDRPGDVRRDGAFDIISCELGPHGVGCVLRQD